jgi:serine O-acetyltransferase
LRQVHLELRYAARNSPAEAAGLEQRAVRIVQDFASTLPDVREQLDNDVQAAFNGDPAARSVDEVLLCYPGVLALIHHRIAHQLYRLGVPLLARIVAELAHAETGIDIHPGAQVGSSFFIDHGTGVVVGETAVIGERVRLYQAVTLGAKRFPTDASGTCKGLAAPSDRRRRRHHLRRATILGRVTIGRGSTIGGNVWVTRSVPPGNRVTQASTQHEPVQTIPPRG